MRYTLWEIVRPYRRQLGVGAVLLAATNGLDKSIPWLLKGAIDALREQRLRAVVVAAAWVVVVAAALWVVRTASRLVIFHVGRQTEFDLRNALCVKLQRIDERFVAVLGSGEMMSRATSDMANVRTLVGFGGMNLVNTVLAYGLALALMFTLSPTLTLWALLPYPGFVLVARGLGRGLFKRSHAIATTTGALSTRLENFIRGIRIQRTYGLEDNERRRFSSLNDRLLRDHLSLVRLRAFLWPLLSLLTAAGTLLVIWRGGSMVLTGELTIGEFVAFNAYLGQLVWPSMAVGFLLAVLQRGRASLVRLQEVLLAPETARGSLAPPPEAGARLSLERVSYAYGAHQATAAAFAAQHVPPARATPTGSAQAANAKATGLSHLRAGTKASNQAAPESPAPSAAASTHALGPQVIRDVSLRLPAQGLVALVGRSGSGKSTLAKLLAGRLLPTSGTAVFGPHALSDLSEAGLAQRIQLCAQEVTLFSTSLRRNLLVGGRFDPAIGKAELLAALQDAGLGPDITSLPQGLDTLVGERGVQLSGGQAQRLALARTLLARAPVMVFDDPISAVDAVTERHLLGTLRALAAQHAVVLITHRASAAALADRIFVLEDGALVEEGTHGELTDKGGIYARLAERQALEAGLVLRGAAR